MNRSALTVAAITAAALTVVGCSSSKPAAAPAAPPAASGAPAPASSAPPAAPSPAAKQAVDATQAVAALAKAVGTAKAGETVTAENDGNHLLGRPGQYTSKAGFTDSRVKASDVDGLDPDDVQRGGAVEVFANAADATARAAYIQAVTKSLPPLAEYDFVHGTTVIRVSHYLTPTQAADYDKAAASLG